jgi:hypothetical protein
VGQALGAAEALDAHAGDVIGLVGHVRRLPSSGSGHPPPPGRLYAASR